MLTKPPVLKAKIILPDIPPGALYCDRIKNLNIAGARAVIVTAPAGYGKTTAVLISLREFRATTHWYRLEKEDAVLSVFFAHLIESLFGEAYEHTDSYKSLSGIGNITEEYPLLSAFVCQDAWSFYARSDKPRFLVFDDFQNTATSAAIKDIIRYLISNMPQEIRMIVISRTETGIPTEKLAIAGELVLIGSRDLLFSKDEIEALFSGGNEPEAAAVNAGDIFDYTEGWIAGVTLMKYTQQRSRTAGMKDFHKDKQGIFRYLLGEVFVGADRDMIRSAAAISLLEEFNFEDLTEIFHFNDSEGTIAWLEHNNFYIHRTNAGVTYYRFHSLLRDALQDVLGGEYSQGEITGFHLAAAARFEKTDRCQQAIDHYLYASDEKNAVRAAAEKGQSFMDVGDIRSAAGLMRRLPEQLILGDATLLMIYGCALSGTETEKGFSYLERAIETAVKNNDLNLAVKTQGFAISVCVQQSNFESIKGVVAKVPTSKALRVSEQARKMLIHSLFLKCATSFQIKPAKVLCRIVDKIGVDDGEELWQFSSLLSKALLYGVTGDFRHVPRLIRELTEHPVALRDDRWGDFGLQLSCLLLSCMGETEGLLRLADKLASLGLKYPTGLASGYGANYTAFAKYQRRDVAGAILAADEAEKLFLEGKNLTMAIFVDIIKMSMQAEQSKNGSFAGRMEEQASALKAAGGNESYLAMAKALTGAQYIKEGGFDRAESLLRQGWKWAKSKQSLQTRCGIAIHLSALYYEKNDLRREEKYLKYFGKTAAGKGYVFFREMRFESLVRACARCVEKNIAPQYMAGLIGKYFGFEAAAGILRDYQEASTAPEAFIRRFPANTESEIINVWVKLFGSFGMTAGGKEIGPEVFKTRKISGIFRYILASAGQIISRESLIAAFWPGLHGKEAESSLRVALFELRRILAGLDMAFDSRSALIAESRDGLYVCRPEAVECDVSRFDILHGKLSGDSLTKSDERAALYELTNLYDGDYLEDSITEDCVAARLHYRAAFYDAAEKLAEIYRSEGWPELAETLLSKQRKSAAAELTKEETEVARLLLDGMTRRDIARKLRLNTAEAEQHETTIRQKLNLIEGPDTIITTIAAAYKLTKREAVILKYLRDSTSTEEIAAELYVTVETVRFHVRNLLKKLDIKTVHDVTVWLDRYQAK